MTKVTAEQLENMTFADYARHRGWSRQHVSRLVKAGKIPLNGSGRIDAADADFALDGAVERINTPRAAARGEGFGGDANVVRLTQARTAGATYDARMKQLHYEALVGKLLQRADAERAMQRCAEILAADIDRFPARVDDILTAFKAGGHKAAKAAMRRAAEDLRRQLAESMKIAAAADEDAESDE